MHSSTSVKIRPAFRLGVVARGALAAVVAVSSLALAAPASAETSVFKDDRGDMGDRADIIRVRVVNEKNVRVRIKHENLTRRGSRGASVYLDTNFDRRGPEYVFVAGITAGTDFVLMRARRWQGRGEPLTCAHDLKLDFAGDVSVFKVSRGCLRDPRAVKVAVQVGAHRNGESFTDWLVKRRHLTPRVARG